jgi:predicted oxidoreductase
MGTGGSDVLIVGGGIGGIATALDLLDSGKSVTLLDRDGEGAFGGLARESFGGMFFVDSPEQRRQGIRDGRDLAFRDWLSFAEFGADDVWPKAQARPMWSDAPRTSIAGCAAMASAFCRSSTGPSGANSVPAIRCRAAT